MNDGKASNRDTGTEPQPKPETTPTAPNASMPNQGGGSRSDLLTLAGQDLHRLVRDRPLSGSGAQPCRKLATAPTQAHEASPRHRAHIPGSIGGAAVGGGDLLARAGRPDKRLHQIRHHRGQRPRGSDAIHQGARQAKRVRWALPEVQRPTPRTQETTGRFAPEPLVLKRTNSH